MAELFLIPIISIYDVHDVAVREWLNKMDDSTIRSHLEYPFKLDRHFPAGARQALSTADDVHNEIVRLLDVIDPQAVLIDISTDLTDIENRYNERLISPFEFWSEYYHHITESLEEPARTIYNIYIKDIIEKKVRLIESKEHLPLSVIFYGLDKTSREELIPVYENAFDKDGEFLLEAARTINEISPFTQTPKHIWYTSMNVRQMAISYEETERFYDELRIRLERRLKYKVRDFIIKNLSGKARDFILAYEKFLDYKMREDEIKFLHIIEGLEMLRTQSDYPVIVIFCGPMHYSSFLSALETKNKLPLQNITSGNIDISRLLDKMKPFTQKNRIMQRNYEFALNILGTEKPEKYNNPASILIPA